MGKIGVVGGGVMGLTLAYRLSQKGFHVEVLEGDPQIGGLSTWFDYGDFLWDKYYHVILQSDQHLLKLIQDVNLSDQLSWTPTKTGFLWHGELCSMSNYWEFFRFPPLTFFQKIRLGLGILYSQHLVEPYEGQKAKDWLHNLFGKSIYEAIWEPLLISKYGVLKDEVPATIIWSILNRYYSTRSKKDGREWMGHLKGSGLKAFLETLVSEISKKKGTIRLNEKVVEITSEDKVTVKTEKGSYQYDYLINTTPTVFFQKNGPKYRNGAHESNPAKIFGCDSACPCLKKVTHSLLCHQPH